MGCFYTLYEEHLLNQKVLVLQTPEWKFKANIARNATFEGRQGQIFAKLELKIAKN